MVRQLLYITVLSFIVSIFLLLNVEKADALSIDRPCTKVEFIFARGSGQVVNDKTKEASKFFEQLRDRLKDTPSISTNQYELGSESYGGYKYLAVDVNFWNGHALGSYVSAGHGNDYGRSVWDGAEELWAYLGQRYERCKSFGTYYILGGYSQGGQVMGLSLWGIPKYIRDRIVFVGLFGDPKLYLPEGGIWFPPACRGQNLSLYRRLIADCHISNGRLGSRRPYLPDDMKSKTGLWCIKDDFVCGTSQNPFASGHGNYGRSGGPIDYAAAEAAARLLNVISYEPSSTPAPSMSPEPPFDLSKITHKFGDGQNGQDVVFIVDAYNMTYDPLWSIGDFLEKTVPGITDKGGHIALEAYAGTRFSGGESFTALGGAPFDRISGDGDAASNYMYFIVSNGRTLYQGSALDALTNSINILNWHDGAAKSIILFSTNPNISGPGTSQHTMSQLINRSLAVDPVNIYPVVPEEYADSYKSIADLTAGQVIPYTNDLEQAANTALDKIYNRPAVFLKNTEYAADPGQEITFDASDSYVIDGTITKYDWDFDGDGTFDETTTTPVINYTYNEKFDGMMQVRATGSNGTVANASATVKIGTYAPPVLPQAPAGLQATVIETKDGMSTVRLTWQPTTDSLTKALSLSVNGIMLGIMTPDRTSIDITDVDRSIDVDFGVAGVGVDGTNLVVGDSAIVTLAKPRSEARPSATEPVANTSKPATPETKTASTTSPADPIDAPSVLGMQTKGINKPTTNVGIIAAAPLHDSKKSTLPGLPWYGIVLAVVVTSGLAVKIFGRFRSRR